MFRKILYSVAFVLMLMSLSACSSSPSDTPPSVSADATDQSSEQSSIVSGPDTNAQTLDTDDSTRLEPPSDTVENPVDTEPIADTTISLESLWSKIAGVWYDPQTEYLEFFVIEYDEEKQPVIYNVWGFDRDENVLATGISNVEDNRYEVTFENGSMKLIFDCSENGKLVISASDNSSSWNYDFLAPTLDEAYDIIGVYENAGGEEPDPSIQLPDEAIEKINENLKLIGFDADMYLYREISSIYYEYGDYTNGLYYAEQCFSARRSTDEPTEPYEFAIMLLNLASHYDVPANEFEQLKALAIKYFGQNQDFMFMLAQVS